MLMELCNALFPVFYHLVVFLSSLMEQSETNNSVANCTEYVGSNSGAVSGARTGSIPSWIKVSRY